MAPGSRPTWRREVQRYGPPRNENTRAPGLLAQVFEAAQKGDLRERVVWLDGSKPWFAMIPLSDLRWLESGAGAPEKIPTVAWSLGVRGSLRRPAAPENITARENLTKAWWIATEGKARVALTIAGKEFACVCLLDDLAALEEAAAEAAPSEAAAGGVA